MGCLPSPCPASLTWSEQMTTYCPECGSPDTEAVNRVDPRREGGPGEWYLYWCGHCGRHFNAIMPEPPDNYEGDGVFAENH
jgi:DNA-directed RNA polymerase subunit RPC12/RpoP